MPNLIVETDAFPTTLSAPAAGESASAPGLLSLFLQGAANRTRYLYNRVKKLTDGGVFTLVAPLSFLDSSVIFDAILVNEVANFSNGLTVDGGGASIMGATNITGNANVSGALTVVDLVDSNAVSTHDLFANGVIELPSGFAKRMTQGSVGGTTYSFAAAGTDIVWNTTNPTTGTIWRVADSVADRPISFNHFGVGGGGIAIHTPTGTLLAVLNNVSGQLCGVTVAFVGGQHQIVETRWKP